MRIVIAIVLITLLSNTVTAHAQGSRAGGAPRLDYEVKATGLTPVFPERYTCEPVASAWGSPERFDSSTRLQSRNSGLHGGLDISLPEGTPVLAIAAGIVIAKGAGGTLEGNYLWMQHAPEDSGLPYRAVVKFQHLSELPKLNVGDRVAAGQIVASSGLTGTMGRAFGPAGYSHLHISMFVAPIAEPAVAAVPPRDGKLSDPMLLFLPAGADYANAAEFPEAAKRVPVAVTDRSGRLEPAGGKTVWPVYCSTR
jgi:murein DD-endopeptidase MepM/ murein hydrolase activator NlpD